MFLCLLLNGLFRLCFESIPSKPPYPAYPNKAHPISLPLVSIYISPPWDLSHLPTIYLSLNPTVCISSERSGGLRARTNPVSW